MPEFEQVSRTIPEVTVENGVNSVDRALKARHQLVIQEAISFVSSTPDIRLQLEEFAGTRIDDVIGSIGRMKPNMSLPNLYETRPDIGGVDKKKRLSRQIGAAMLGEAKLSMVRPDDVFEVDDKNFMKERVLVLSPVVIARYPMIVSRLERDPNPVNLESVVTHVVGVTARWQRQGIRQILVPRLQGGTVREWSDESMVFLQEMANRRDFYASQATKLASWLATHPYRGGAPGTGRHS